MENPVKDTGIKSMKSAINRRHLNKMDREELEDRYVTLFDENIVLKKYGKKRDEEIKKLCTIQARLEKDRKKLLADTGVKSGSFYEEKLKLQDDKIHSLERHVEQLKIKLKLQKEHTSIAQLANNPTYAYVNSKVDTGVIKQQIDPQLIKNIKMIIQPNKSSSAKLKVIPHMEKMVDGGTETSPVIDNKEFEHQREIESLIERHNNKLREYEMMINTLEKKMVENEKAHENAISLLKLKMMEEENKVVFRQPSVEFHSGRNEEKFNQLLDQFQNLEQKTIVLRKNNESAAMEIENLNGQLRQEQQRYLELKNQLQVENNKSYRIEELETQLHVARRECELLKESNDNLLHKSFETRVQNVPQSKTDIESQKRETSLRIQLAQMEAAMKIELESKDDLLDRLSKEKRSRLELQEECQDLKRKKDELVIEMDVLKEKAALFDDNSGVLNHSEFIEALALVKKRKSGNDDDFYVSVPLANKDEMTLEIRSLKCQLKDAINELEKARSMLVVQYRLNKDCKNEIESMAKKMENSKRETDIELDRYAQLLDIRAQRIRKLEDQLKDIAYGRGSQVKNAIEPGFEEYNDEDDVIENGKNLLEIHISKAQLTEEGVALLNDASASVFITLDFYDFQTQTTPILNGPKADFNYTSQYVVVFDDVFIHYLHKDFCTVELHHNIGENFKTIGAVLLSCREVITEPGERLHGSIELKGVAANDTDVTYAVMDYWVRLKVPMEQALRQYRERCIALGYLESNLLYTEENLVQTSPQTNNHNINNSAQQAKLTKLQQMNHSRRGFEHPTTTERNRNRNLSKKENFPSTPPKRSVRISQLSSQDEHLSHEVNENRKFQFLEVNVINCSDLNSYRNSNLPSTYITYKLHEFEEHATPVVPESRNPLFNDVRLFDIHWSNSFSSYLKEELKLFVMTLDESGEPSRFGQATIPLSPLLQNSQLKDTFVILDSSDEVVGTLEVMFTWKDKNSAADEKEFELKPKNREKKRDSIEMNDDMKQGSSNSSLKSVERLKAPTSIEDQNVEETNIGLENEEKKQEINITRPILKERSSIHGSISSKGSEDGGMTDAISNAHNKTIESINTSALNTKASLLDELDDEDQPNDNSKTNDDTICVEISNVRLNNGSPVLQDSKVKMLYVAYQFLGESPENTETPVSMPKPSLPSIPIEFNFKKEFYVDEENNSTKRQYLKEMINSQDPEYSSIKFTLISEPQNNDDDCEDIGVAQVNLKKILETEKDVLDEEVLIRSEADGSAMGYMTLTVSCLQTLKNLYKEEIME